MKVKEEELCVVRVRCQSHDVNHMISHIRTWNSNCTASDYMCLTSVPSTAIRQAGRQPGMCKITQQPLTNMPMIQPQNDKNDLNMLHHAKRSQPAGIIFTSTTSIQNDMSSKTVQISPSKFLVMASKLRMLLLVYF